MKRILHRPLSNISIESYQSVFYCAFKNYAFLQVVLLENSRHWKCNNFLWKRLLLLIPWRCTAHERISIRHNWRLTMKFFLTAQNCLENMSFKKCCYFFPNKEIFLAHLCIALEPSIMFLNNWQHNVKLYNGNSDWHLHSM